ncbi:MAG: class I SAM-dependent methyltransferase [Deltaproteobacteria bacterium]|nr:class I SAM-dependent methyltransferase [Deltaproteobacteria bacterium]MBZ0219976.1 class I SAM-dependent methyltransferase [Deltaproteobacteria bacterium]
METGCKEAHELEFQKLWLQFDKDFLSGKLLEYWKKYRFFDEVQTFIRPLQGKKVLDIGCGVISVLNLIKEPGAELHGIDPLMDEYKQLYKLDDGIDWSAAPGEKVPFPGGYFDIVFCTNVLDHTENPDAVLDEVRRVLKDGGVFVLTTDIFKVPEKRNPAHPHAFTDESVDILLDRHGMNTLFNRNSQVRAQVFRFMKNDLIQDDVREKVVVARKA